jgi:two-component system, LytTR family, response regulator
MVKILIIDDEPAAGDILQLLVERNIHCEKEIRVTHSPAEGIQLIRDWNPQLLMLDIEMPAMNGFDLLSKLSAPAFHVIFTTAYDKYAVKAIRFSALDYLLKPIDRTELINAFDRFFNAAALPTANATEQVETLIKNLRQKRSASFKLVLSTIEGVHVLSTSDILYCEGLGNYTRFHLQGRREILVSKTIKEYEELLQEQSFIRVHKSFLVNTRHIIRYEKEGILWLTNDHTVAVSRRKKDMVRSILSL